MGLQTWKNAPDGKILKTDIGIAKNYLTETELKQLDRIVSMYLDFAENQAERQVPMTMQDWAGKLDAFLAFNGYELLTNARKVQSAVAKKLAETHYDTFRVEQDKLFESDFDKILKKWMRHLPVGAIPCGCPALWLASTEFWVATRDTPTVKMVLKTFSPPLHRRLSNKMKQPCV